MVITKTPYRVSLFGGGTDFPQWYKDHPGKVVSFSINKYCHIGARVLPPFFERKYRIVYSKIELVNEVKKIDHPAVREAIKRYSPMSGLEIHHFGDLPARSGVGSSSAFAVGIISSLTELENSPLSKFDLANAAIEFEQKVLAENVGSQDQIACTFGGLNEISFENDSWQIDKIFLTPEHKKEIEKRLVLIYTGQNRLSSNISRGFIEDFDNKKELLIKNFELAEEGAKILRSGSKLDQIGDLLNISWNLKKRLNKLSTNSKLDDLYDHVLKSGAIGGKVLGAGGGGFMLFWLKEGSKLNFYENLNKSLLIIPVKISIGGSIVILNSNRE